MYALLIAVTGKTSALGATILNRLMITVVELGLFVVGIAIWRLGRSARDVQAEPPPGRRLDRKLTRGFRVRRSREERARAFAFDSPVVVVLSTNRKAARRRRGIRAMKVGRFLLRLSMGLFFIGHGTQKLFGWFGGGGLDATAEGFEKLGLRPGRTNAIVGGVAEAGGGALLAAGLATPLAATALTATMLTAIERVHLNKGPWAANGGYEYNVVLIAALLALAESGPGGLLLEARRGEEALAATVPSPCSQPARRARSPRTSQPSARRPRKLPPAESTLSG